MTIRTCVTAALCMAVLGVLGGCTNDENPYLDQSKSDLTVAIGGLSSGDTIEVFSTDTVTVELKLQVHIQRFTVRVDGNRYWQSVDTTVASSAYGDSWRFSYPVSFHDTGWTMVRVWGWLENGDSIGDSISLYRHSPLNQPDITAEPGEQVELRTDPVDDPYVLYVWRFGNDSSTVNDQPTARKTLTSAAFGGATFITASLYVKSGGKSSPADTFNVFLADKTPPAIVCLNDSLSPDSSRVYTGAVPFFFRVGSRDDGNAIAHVLINGEKADTCTVLDQYTWECTEELVSLAPAGDSLPVVVEAADSRGNTAVDTFWVIYDSTLSSTPTIVVDEPLDSAHVPSHQVTFHGDIANMYGYDTLYLTMSMDGAGEPDDRILTPGNSAWRWEVTMAADTADFVLALENRIGDVRDTLDVAHVTVIYDSSLVDIVPPTIQSVTSGGSPVSDGFVTDLAELPLLVSVVDQSGVAWVRIDGVDAVRQSDGTFLGSATLEHVPEGNTVTISAADIPGNTGDVTRLIYRNRPPRIVQLPPTRYVTSGVTHRDTVTASDPDGDPMTITLLVHARSGDLILTADDGGVFTWTPVDSDTGHTLVDVQVSDGYPQGAEGQFAIQVTAPEDTIPQAHFVTTAGDFPDSIRATIDMLSVPLRIDQPANQGTYLFSARLVESGVVLMAGSPDTLLTWAPALADTGAHTIEVIVTSGPDVADTIIPMPVVQVVAPPSPIEVHFVSGQSGVSESAGAAQIAVHLSKAPTNPVTVPYRVQNAGTTADSLDYTLPLVKELEFAPGATTAHIPLGIVDDSTVESTEKVSLLLEKPVSPDSAVLVNPISHVCYITDNDTVSRIDTISFAAADSGGPEGLYTVSVPLRLRSPASKQIRVVIRTTGSATPGSDFTVWPTDITFAPGEQDTTVQLTILDDMECEPTTESVGLRLEKRTPGVVMLDSVYVFGILPSDTNLCAKPWAFVHGREHLLPFEDEMGWRIEDLGYDLVYVWEPQAGNLNWTAHAGVVVSATVRDSWIGSALKDASVPVVCLSPRNAVTLDLTTSSDTGHSAGNALKLYEQLLTQWGQVLPITESLVNVPYAQPSFGGTITASIASSQADTGYYLDGSGPIMPGPIDTLAAISWYEGGDGSIEGNYPARRVTFPVCRPLSGTSEIFYTAEYWALFEACVAWAGASSAIAP